MKNGRKSWNGAKMNMFDFILPLNRIQRGKPPKPGVDYIYMLHIAWKDDVFDEFPIKENTIVTDVVQNENYSYSFRVKENGEEFRCNYPTSFAENTPENVKAIERIKSLRKAIKKRQEEINSIYEKITLKL